MYYNFVLRCLRPRRVGSGRGRFRSNVLKFRVAIVATFATFAGSLGLVSTPPALAAVPTPLYQITASGIGPENLEAADDRLVSKTSSIFSLSYTPEDTCVSLYRDDKPLLNVEDDLSLAPASLMKIVTAAAALDVMGADAVYTTEVFADFDSLVSVTGGVLWGDLYLVGGGDPILSTPHYIEQWSEPKAYTDITVLADRVMASLKSYGIHRIEGRIIGDESWFSDTDRDYTQVVPEGGIDPLWKQEWVDTNLVGPLSGLLLNDGYSSYKPSAGRRANVRAVDPAQHAASSFDDLLEARGMIITGKPRSGIAPDADDLSLLGGIDSPPMSEILKRVLSRSDNTTAEMIFKEIGRRTFDSTRAGAMQGAEEVLQRLLGPLASDVTIVDGSGLSYYNRMTCRAVAHLLLHSEPDSPLLQGLSPAGSTGTLRNCGPRRAPDSVESISVVQAKTGSLDHVTALAGASIAVNGSVVAFSMIANEPDLVRIGFCNNLQRTLIDAVSWYTNGTKRDSTAFTGTIFTDTIGNAYEADIAAVAAAGITRGCSEELLLFCPDLIVTRAQMASFLTRAFKLSTPDPAFDGNIFHDVLGSVHEEAVSTIVAAGITRGCSQDGTLFCPYEPIKRAQMASFLARALGFLDTNGDNSWITTGKGSPGTDEERGSDNDWPTDFDETSDDGSRLGSTLGDIAFSDVLGSVHEQAVSAVVAAGIMPPCSEDELLFCPYEPVTRAEMASFLAKALEL